MKFEVGDRVRLKYPTDTPEHVFTVLETAEEAEGYELITVKRQSWAVPARLNSDIFELLPEEKPLLGVAQIRELYLQFFPRFPECQLMSDACLSFVRAVERECRKALHSEGHE